MDNEVDGRSPSEAESGTTQTKKCSACPDAKATSFCVDCHEYLCQGCTNYHHRLKVLKDHKLLTGANFPSGDPPVSQDHKKNISEKCIDHPKKEIQFYCDKHDALCCIACSVLNHEHCTKLNLPDIAREYKSGPELQSLHNGINNTEQLVVKSIGEVEECLKAVETLNVDELEKLQKYKAKIIEYLDRREEELRTEMQQYHDQDVNLLQELLGKFKTCQSVVNDIKEKLKSHEKDLEELFIASKRARNHLAKLQSSLQELTEKIGYKQYSLELAPNIKNSLQDKDGFAGVEMITELSAANLKQQLTISLNKRQIEDMVLVSTDKLLVAFHEKRKIMLVKSESGQMVSEITLQDNPHMICMIGTHGAAVTSNNRNVHFIQVSANQLKVVSSLKMDVDVVGIAAHQQNLVMAYMMGISIRVSSYYTSTSSYPGVKIISKDGTEIHKLDNAKAGREVFKDPRRITTTSDGSIYVTDYWRHEITRLDSSLTILQTFSSDKLKYPTAIISLNCEQFLVCSGNNNSIVLIRPRSNSMTILLEKQDGIEDGIERPKSICFCKEQKKLYVAPREGNRVVVYCLL